MRLQRLMLLLFDDMHAFIHVAALVAGDEAFPLLLLLRELDDAAD